MSRRAKILAMFAGASVLVIAAALLLPAVLARSHSAQRASLTFLTVTNCRVDRWHTGTHAMFCLSNDTASRLCYYAESMEVRGEQGWEATILRCSPTNWFGFATILARGKARTFCVPLPTDRSWRIRITCQERADGLQGVKDRIDDFRDNRNPANAGVRGERFNGFSYQIVSPEVTK